MTDTPYTLGRLAAALHADERTVYRACESPLALTPLITQATQDAAQRERIAPLMEQIEALPTTLDNAAQGRFMLGYYHERYTARTGHATPYDESLADARMEVRLPSDLKTWALANGGSKLIRALLEAARERSTS